MRMPCMAVVLLLLAAASASAQEPVAALSADDLADQRGGFTTPDGLQVGFGAVVRTYVDGALALQTRLTWTPEGAVKTVEGGSLTPDLATRAQASGLTLQGHLDGVLIEGQGGATAVLHDLTSNRIADVVVNNANNRDIRQATDITLNLPDFARMQAGIAGQRANLSLQDAVSAALRDSALR